MRGSVKYLLTLLAGIAMAAWVAWSKNILEQTGLKEIFHILTDAFFIPAVLLLGIGGLIFTTNEGAFDAVVFGLKSFWSMFSKKLKRNRESYYDYTMARREKKLPFGFLLICGLIFLAVSMVMYYLYCRYS